VTIAVLTVIALFQLLFGVAIIVLLLVGRRRRALRAPAHASHARSRAQPVHAGHPRDRPSHEISVSVRKGTT
jgi:hypothetical protein